MQEPDFRVTIAESSLFWNRRIDHDLHTASRFIVELLISEGIGTLALGKNDGWKQEARLGHRTNQRFVQIPHARFIQIVWPTHSLYSILEYTAR